MSASLLDNLLSAIYDQTTVSLSSNGQLSVYNKSGPADVLVDVVGYYY